MNGPILDKIFTKNELDFDTKLQHSIARERKAIYNGEHINIPKPFRVWCHPCNKGFMNIEEYQKHKVTPQHERAKEAYFNVQS